MDRQTCCIVCKEKLFVTIKYADREEIVFPPYPENIIKLLDMPVESELEFLNEHKPSITVQRWCPKCGLLYKP